MPWVKPVEESEADGEVKEVYHRIAGDKGRLGNLEKVRGLLPQTIRLQSELYKVLMFGPSDLSRVQREMIVLVISRANRCRY